MNKKEFVRENITVNKEAKTGKILNHNSEVVILVFIGKKLLLLFILICSQKIDNGYKTLEKKIR